MTVYFKELLQLSDLLAGLRILVLEDEFLIAMDVEQLCRDHGAHDVTIVQSLEGASGKMDLDQINAAVIDVMLAGVPTLDFARTLKDRGLPFVFASGYTDFNDIAASFPGIALVGKPYAGDDLVHALASACGRKA